MIPLPAVLPVLPRPEYTLTPGDAAHYRYERVEGESRATAVTTLTVVAVRRGTVELRATVTEIAPKAPDHDATLTFDRWLYRKGKSDYEALSFEPLLRLEKPGTRPGAAYSLIRGPEGASAYEIRDPSSTGSGPSAIVPTAAVLWRKTVILPERGLPLSADIETTFAEGATIRTSLVRTAP